MTHPHNWTCTLKILAIDKMFPNISENGTNFWCNGNDNILCKHIYFVHSASPQRIRGIWWEHWELHSFEKSGVRKNLGNSRFIQDSGILRWAFSIWDQYPLVHQDSIWDMFKILYLRIYRDLGISWAYLEILVSLRHC